MPNPEQSVSSFESLERTTGGATGINSLLTGLRNEGTGLHAKAPALAAISSNEQTSASWDASPDVEKALVREVREQVAAAGDARAAAADEFWVLASVRARKGDTARAAARLRAFVAWRTAVDSNFPEDRETLREILQLGLFVSSGKRDREGRYILHGRLRFADPSRFSALHVVRAIALIIEWTLRTYPDAQKCGIAILGDMSNVGFHNMDVRVPREMSNAFSQTLPVRVAGMYMMNLPWFIRPAFALVSALLSRKLKNRVRGISQPEELGQYFDMGSVPMDANMGGKLAWDLEMNKEWVERVMQDSEKWPPVSSVQKQPPE